MSAVAAGPASAAAARADASGADVEPVVAPPPGNPRFPLVDGLRAVAALSVVGFHAAFFAGALGTVWWGEIAGRLEIGVALFFAISGFLLYRPFAAAHLDGRRGPSAGAFYRRRVLRIVPAYWLALTVLAIYPGLAGVFTGDWWIFYGFGQVYTHATLTQGIPQAWTLCVEASFYLLLPAYAAVLRALGRKLGRPARVRLELAVLALLSAACLALRAHVLGAGPSVLPYTLPGLFDWFAAGMALAVASAWLATRPREPRWATAVGTHPGGCWLAAAAVFAALVLLVPAPSSVFPYSEFDYQAINVLSPVVAVLVLAPAVVGPLRAGWPRRLLGLAPVAWLGVVSYGIYLWHVEPMAWLAGRGIDRFPALAALGAAIAVALAAASYYAVERPLLRFKDPRRRRAG